MSCWLSLKRLLKQPALLLMLVILATCIFMCGAISRDDGIPSCGVVAGNCTLAKETAVKMSDDGIILYQDEEALQHAIQKGEIAMGFIFPNDFERRLASGNTHDMIRFIESPTAVLQYLYKYRAAAYIMEAYAPYLVSSILTKDGFEISHSEMKSAIDEYLKTETEFVFTVETAEGALIEPEHYSLRLTQGVLALFLFFAFGIFAVPYTEKQFAVMAWRIGFKKTFTHYALPSILLTMLMFSTACGISLWLTDMVFMSDTVKLFPAAISYIIFLSALGIIVTALFGSTEKLRIPIIAICLLSLAYCPIFADVPSLVGLPVFIKFLLPTMFFYAAEKYVLGAIILFAAAIGIYAAIQKHKYKMA